MPKIEIIIEYMVKYDKCRRKNWITLLDDEEVEFIRRFVLLSGSIKDMASEYGISYPTLRHRLDDLRKKIAESDNTTDEYILLVQQMAMDGRIDIEAARFLIQEYRYTKR